MTSVVTSWQTTQGTHYADYVGAVIGAGLKRWQGDLAGNLAQAAAEAHADAVLSAAESSADARRDREIAGAGLAWATIVGPAWRAAAAAQAAAAAAAIGALADASQVWQSAIGSAFVGWAMAQAQAGADFGIAGAIAGATAGKAGAAAGSIYAAAVSKASGDLTRSLNAVQTGFVDAATAASLKATKAIAAAETVERKAVAKADIVLAQDLQTAWGTYAAAERSAVTLNAREQADIGVAYKKKEKRCQREKVPAAKSPLWRSFSKERHSAGFAAGASSQKVRRWPSLPSFQKATFLVPTLTQRITASAWTNGSIGMLSCRSTPHTGPSGSRGRSDWGMKRLPCGFRRG